MIVNSDKVWSKIKIQNKMTESDFSGEPLQRQKLLLQKEETIYFRSNKEWFKIIWECTNSKV